MTAASLCHEAFVRRDPRPKEQRQSDELREDRTGVRGHWPSTSGIGIAQRVWVAANLGAFAYIQDMIYLLPIDRSIDRLIDQINHPSSAIKTQHRHGISWGLLKNLAVPMVQCRLWRPGLGSLGKRKGGLAAEEFRPISERTSVESFVIPQKPCDYLQLRSLSRFYVE